MLILKNDLKARTKKKNSKNSWSPAAGNTRPDLIFPKIKMGGCVTNYTGELLWSTNLLMLGLQVNAVYIDGNKRLQI